LQGDHDHQRHGIGPMIAFAHPAVPVLAPDSRPRRSKGIAA
jgi:hypothetical protein